MVLGNINASISISLIIATTKKLYLLSQVIPCLFQPKTWNFVIMKWMMAAQVKLNQQSILDV